MSSKNDSAIGDEQYKAASIRLMDDDTVVIEADAMAWEKTLEYLPRAVDVTSTGGAVYVQPGLEYNLVKFRHDDSRLQIIVEHPSRRLRRFAKASTSATIVVVGDKGRMVLTSLQRPSEPGATSAWWIVSACFVVCVIAIGSLLYITDGSKLRVPFVGSVDIAALRTDNTPTTNVASEEGNSQTAETDSSVTEGAAHGEAKPGEGNEPKPAPALSETQAAVLVQNASKGRAHMVRMFRDDDAGMTGVVLEGNTEHAQSTIAWILPGPPAKLIIGSVFGDSGRNFTEAASSRYEVSLSVQEAKNRQENAQDKSSAADGKRISDDPLISDVAPSADDAAKFNERNSTADQPEASADSDNAAQASLSPAEVYRYLDDSGAISSISRGEGTNPIYVLFDPNCIYCHSLWQTVQESKDLVDRNDVDIRWVPVAVMSETSLGRSAALIKSGMPALKNNERDFDTATEQGGVTPLADPPTGLIDRVKANTALLYSDGEQPATPTLIWRNADQVEIAVGAPRDTRFAEIVKEARTQ